MATFKLRSKIGNTWKKIEAFFPKDSLSRLLLQFALIVVAGTFLSNHFAEKREVENRKLTLLREGLDERTKFVNEFTKIVNRRLFLMQLVYWEIHLHNEATDYRQNQLKSKYEDYYQILVEWNSYLHYHLISLDNHFGKHKEMIDKMRVTYKLDKLPSVDSLRELTVKVMQKKFGALHKQLKKAKDKRIEFKQKIEDTDLESLKEEYVGLADVTYQYLELIYILSRDPNTLRN
jgi:hypothetical protein